MRSNTVAAAPAESIPSDGARRQPPPRATPNGARLGPPLRLAAAIMMVAGASLGLSEAATGATSRIGFVPPAAQIRVVDANPIPPRALAFHDVHLFRSCGVPHVPYVAFENGGGFAAAQAGKRDDHFATASADGYGSALAEATVFVRNTDPQSRGTVKLNVKFKGRASAGPDPIGYPPVTSANYQIMIGNLSRTPTALVNDGDCTIQSADWIEDVMQQPRVFEVLGYDYTYADLNGDIHNSSRVQTYSYGQLTGDATQPDRPQTETIAVGSNQAVIMVVRATAGNGGMATVDPIITAHPDNPDVVVEIDGPDGPTGKHPLDGFTAEGLAARGIDPQPFINLGFFVSATPADTIAPTTTATPSPGPNTIGWNDGAVKVDLAAADDPGGSGVKEIHIALSGATTGSRVQAASSASVDIAAEGQTALTYFAVDNAGNQESPKTLTVRIDKTPPSLTGLPASGCTLWPPDHRLVQVASVASSDAASGLGGLTIAATSSEPETGTGDGDVGPDVVVEGGVVKLRAERAGNGVGRTYTITARATDKAGNVASETRTCTVPHDRGKS